MLQNELNLDIIGAVEIGLMEALAVALPTTHYSWYYVGDFGTTCRALRSYRYLGVQIPSRQWCFDFSHITITNESITTWVKSDHSSLSWPNLLTKEWTWPSGHREHLAIASCIPLADPNAFVKIIKMFRRPHKLWPSAYRVWPRRAPLALPR